MSSSSSISIQMVCLVIVGALSLVVIPGESAPIVAPLAPIEPTLASGATEDIQRLTSAGKVEATAAAAAAPLAESAANQLEPVPRSKRAGGAEHLESQETGYLPGAYQQATDSDYGYDSGKNSYGKQASDWSLYDQGNHGLYDKYGDKAYTDQGHSAHNNHGKHDSYGNTYNSHGSGHGSGYYSRDRGYGYEKHYAYDKEVASKQHADNHNSYGSQHGLHDNYGNAGSHSHAHHGHDKYGQLSRYGNHGYGKKGSNLAAHHDYGHNLNKGHHYAQSSYPGSYPSYSAHVPTYRSTYSDYSSPQVGYPSSYPSYY